MREVHQVKLDKNKLGEEEKFLELSTEMTQVVVALDLTFIWMDRLTILLRKKEENHLLMLMIPERSIKEKKFSKRERMMIQMAILVWLSTWMVKFIM